MNATAGIFFGWLVRASWQAAVLAMAVFLFQWLFRKHLNARWRYALWFLVLTKLLLPIAPHSPISLFNYARLNQVTRESEWVQPTPPVLEMAPIVPSTRTPERAGRMPAATDWKPVPPAPKLTVSKADLPSRREGIPFWREHIGKFSAIIWAIGMTGLGLRILLQNIVFVHRLRTSRLISDAQTIQVFEQCKLLLRIRFPIRLVETSEVKSPALHGWFRPCLLLPEQMIGAFSPQELRYVFLHELAHVKRRDMAVHWLATALKILHWFNPVLWLSFRRMAADRELACDEMALVLVGEQGSKPYGEAIIKVLERCAHRPGLPCVVGILEDKDQMTRRISMILKFKKRSQHSWFAMLLLLALGLLTLTDARNAGTTEPGAAARLPEDAIAQSQGTTREEEAVHPDLSGEIRGKDGAPVAATVFIFTAAPKVGSSTFCPSCYLDCRKSAKAGPNGSFKIESLDPQLLFRVLVVAKNYEPRFVAKVDPANGPIEVQMKVSEVAQAGPERTLSGRVVDSKGDPIVGAVVNSHGIARKDGRTSWGALSGVDPLAVTDENGEFRITARDPFQSMDVRIEARAFANKMFRKLAGKTRRHDLVMTEGATVTGRVIFQGKPLKDVSVGMVSVDRQTEDFLGNFEVGTGADGRFTFVNLPADLDYFIYGLMPGMQPYGAVPSMKIHSAQDDHTSDVGDLVVEPGYRLAGRVVLADGTGLPPKTRLMVGREYAWDSLQLTLAVDGSFDATGIPRGAIALSVQVPGYRASAKNASLDLLNPFELIGRVDRDVTNLVLLMEKGARLEPEYNGNGPESDRPRNRPLHGAEVGPDYSREWLVSGRVIDSESGESIPHFRVIPGNAELTFGGTRWDAKRSAEGVNGICSVYLDKRWGQPALQARAEGYLPERISLVPLRQIRADMILKKGVGPSGTILLPDGMPAPGASVFLSCVDDEQPGRLDMNGELVPYQNKERSITTDAGGRFSFAPELGMEFLAAASPAGFKKLSMASLKTNSNIRLEPYGRIRGSVKRASGPARAEDLDLAFADEGPVTRLFLSNHVVTDDQGRFEFDHVPPGNLQISSRQISPQGNKRSWSNEPLERIALKPGQTLEVTIFAPDRSAAQDSDLGIRTPEPVRQPGVQLKGQVLSPDGKPAAEAQVGLEVEGKYLVLAKASFRIGGVGQSAIATTDPNGDFSLPMYDHVHAVIALNDEGFARASLAEFEASPQIKLQAWGRIEGTLHIGHRLATNEIVALSHPALDIGDMWYDFHAFQAKTDDQGRFAITYVPPGEHALARWVSLGHGSSSEQPLGETVVKPGIVTWVNLGGSGRAIIGKLKLIESETNVNWQRMRGSLHTQYPNISPPVAVGKTQEEQSAYQRTPEYKSKLKEALKDYRSYHFGISDDGSFASDEALPGRYGFEAEELAPQDWRNLHRTGYYLHGEVSIPEPTDKNSDAPVDLGTIELKMIPLDAR